MAAALAALLLTFTGRGAEDNSWALAKATPDQGAAVVEIRCPSGIGRATLHLPDKTMPITFRFPNFSNLEGFAITCDGQPHPLLEWSLPHDERDARQVNDSPTPIEPIEVTVGPDVWARSPRKSPDHH
eukprot:GGOE01018618.1.p2 GENE.GGOE01018618.1~~GGOE01018618.1.p2  ORF type:complete len:136 (+),score=33.76 GGOE01018618.1:26-409(+)